MRGFSLFELLVTLAVIGSIASLSAYMSIGAYQRAQTRSDEDVLDMSLRYTQSLSMHRICRGNSCKENALHGTRVAKDTVTIFQGLSFETRVVEEDLTFPMNMSSGTESGYSVVFDYEGNPK